MITKQDIIYVFWDNSVRNKEYREKVAKILEGYELLGGEIDDGDYSAEMWVLLRKDGKLYEFGSSHCSCNGFDDFDPEETSIESLQMRCKNSMVDRVLAEVIAAGKL